MIFLRLLGIFFCLIGVFLLILIFVSVWYFGVIFIFEREIKSIKLGE